MPTESARSWHRPPAPAAHEAGSPSGSSKAVSLLPLWAQGRPDDWNARAVSHLPSARNRDLGGLSVAEAARVRGAARPEELVCDLQIEEGLELGWRGDLPEPAVWNTMNRDSLQFFARSDYIVGSDSILVGEHPHARAHGCIPRLSGPLRRQYAEVSPETPVIRATELAAQRCVPDDRGLLLPDKAADIVVFDLDAHTDTGTRVRPWRFPIGIEYVLVNGWVAVSPPASSPDERRLGSSPRLRLGRTVARTGAGLLR